MSVTHSHWNNLRKLLSGQSLHPNECTPELAQAAVQGGVLRLAIEQQPQLAPWVSQELEQVVFQDLLLERANQDLATSLGDLEDSLLRLKGSASAHMIYDEPGYRERRDIDLLLLGKSRHVTVERLIKAGWRPLPEREKPWWSKRQSSRYEETMVKNFGGQNVEVDLHFRLSIYRQIGAGENDLRLRSTRKDGLSFRLPSHEDLTLHTALHAASTGFSVPLKSWLDLHLLCSSPSMDWNRLVSEAIAWKMPSALWAGLKVISAAFDTAIPPSALRELTPPRPARESLTRLLGGQGETPIRTGPFLAARRQIAKSLALSGDKPWELAFEQARLRLERPE